MHHLLERFDDDASLADAAASYVAQRARDCVQARGEFIFACSGGTTPWAMFSRLAKLDVPWAQVTIFQVDERIAPEGDATRNLTNLQASLGPQSATIMAMPVNDDDLEDAADRYAALIPERFDMVHLGLGPDGHTASLIPGDPVLAVVDRLVSLTGVYHDERRMTLTYPAIARANQLLWLVAGTDKRAPLLQLLAGDESIPAGRVVAASSLVMADADASPS
ncbi:MAG TPA: 6-phosphogluconolactonase [Acidimicrobiales bacterium]